MSVPSLSLVGLCPACTALALCLVGLGSRADAAFSQKKGPAVLTLDATEKDAHLEIPFAPVALTIAVEGKSGLNVKPPAKWVTSDLWAVVVKGPAREVALPQGRTRWEQTLLVDPLVPGVQELQIEPLQYQEASGAWQTVTWSPIRVTVRPRVTEPDASQLRDITSIEELPRDPPGYPGWPWLLASLGAAGVVIMFVWLWRRRRVLGIGLTPAEWARRELDRLLALGLPARGEGRRFHALLSNVLRHYIERRFALPARRQTTPEFFQTLAKDHQFTPEQQTLLRDVLDRCDLAKFAGVQPPLHECADLAKRVREFIAQTV